jgi:8-hydroxy-5-deazaflavin:NADPH oxidoreductase
MGMKFGILGTGIVGRTIGSKLLSRGHQVMLGGRSKTHEKGEAWAIGEKGASYGDFAAAASFGELVFLCTKGDGALAAAEAAKSGLTGKILIDVTNPLDFSRGFPPHLFLSNTDSLGEQLQGALPETQVVKTLNTMACDVMVDPARLGADSDVLMSGNDEAAKASVAGLLREHFGWKHVVDLGDITTARGTEGYLLLWIRLYGALKTADFNMRLVRR